MSHRIRSKRLRVTAASAPAAESTASTSWPARPRTSLQSDRMPRSSSTTRIVLTKRGYHGPARRATRPLRLHCAAMQDEMKQLWERLEAWAQANAQRSLQLRPPASEDAIAAAEAELGYKFPADYRASL